MNLEQYLRHEYSQGKIDFWMRASITDDGVLIYMHPNNQDGQTTPMLLVKGNVVERWANSSSPDWE